jgi:DNA polymerase III epsilon subunit-like protein
VEDDIVFFVGGSAKLIVYEDEMADDKNGIDLLVSLDLETCDFSTWKKAGTPGANAGLHPRIVSVGAEIWSGSGTEWSKKEELYAIVRPSRFKVTASHIHHISNAYALANGKDLTEVLVVLSEILKQCTYILLYNASFDLGCLVCEFTRVGLDTSCLSHLIPVDCMLYSKIFSSSYISLDAMYRRVIGKKMSGHHNSLSDASATVEIFFKLLSTGSAGLDKHTRVDVTRGKIVTT